MTVEYRDETPFTGDNHTPTELANAIRTKKYGKDVREPIAQLAGKLDSAIKGQNIGSVVATPTKVFANLSALQSAYPNGADGVMVTINDGHKHVWQDNNWADMGVYQSDGIAPALQADIDKAVIGNGLYSTYESVPAELRLFDKVPNNTIISFDFDVSQYPDMHAPANSGKGVLVTLSYSDHKHVTSGGKFQLFHGVNQLMWSRICWSGDHTFKNWVPLNRQDPAIEQPIDEAYVNNHPVYADLNTVPTGTYTYYSNTYVANTPSVYNSDSTYGFTVSTFENRFSLDPTKNNRAGRVQLLVTLDGFILSRISWGNVVSYSDWEPLNGNVGLGVWYDPETGAVSKQTNHFHGEYDLKNASALQPQSVVTYPQNGPEKGVGLGTYLTYNGVNGLGGKAQFAFKSNGELYYRVFWGNPVGEDKAWSKIKIDEPVPSQTPAYLSLFEKVAVIGDSYASGEIYDKDGRNQNGDQYNHSWLAILSRKYGFSYYNYSKGGQTTYGWMHETTRSLGEFNSDGKHFDLYFMNLGINDHDRNSADYAGVKADIDNNVDSFYGNYGRIIEAVKAKDPKAVIAIATITTDSGDAKHKAYDDVIRALASDYNLLLIDFGSPVASECILQLNKHKKGGHPSAVGYAQLAQAFDDGFNNAVAKQETDISSLKELFSD